MNTKMIILSGLLLIFACAEKKETKDLVAESTPTKKDTLINKSETGFIADSSYLKYWCSIEVLEKTANSMDDLAVSTVAEFLASFHRDCSKNAEYSTWANELLFEVAFKKPDFLLGLLHKNNSLDKGLILEEFKSPVSDEINLDEVLDKMEKSGGPNEIKKEVLNALNIAQSKNE